VSLRGGRRGRCGTAGGAWKSRRSAVSGRPAGARARAHPQRRGPTCRAPTGGVREGAEASGTALHRLGTHACGVPCLQATDRLPAATWQPVVFRQAAGRLLKISLPAAAMDGRSAKQVRKQLIRRERVRTCAGRAT